MNALAFPLVGEGGSVFSAMRRLSRGELEELMTRKGGTARSTCSNSSSAVYNAEISLSKYFLPICISEGRCRHWQAHHNRYFPVAGLFHILLSLSLSPILLIYKPISRWLDVQSPSFSFFPPVDPCSECGIIHLQAAARREPSISHLNSL